MYLSKVTTNGKEIKDKYLVHQSLYSLFKRECNFLYRENIDINKNKYYLLLSNEKPNGNNFFKVEEKKFNPIFKKGDVVRINTRVNPVISKRVDNKKNSIRHDIVMNSTKEVLKDIAYKLELEIDENEKTSKVKNKIVYKLKNLNEFDFASKFNISFIPRFKKTFLNSLIDKRIMNDVRNWLEKRSDECGFCLEGNYFKINNYQKNLLFKKNKKINFWSLDIKTIVKITDVEKFVKFIKNGIGKEKRFGCGLTLVKYR